MRETLQRIFNFLLRAYSSTGKFIYLGYVCWEECCSSYFKGALSGLRQFFVTESPLKMLFISPLNSFGSQDI